MPRPFTNAMRQIDQALQRNDLVGAGRLLLQAAEIASQEGMVVDGEGRVMTVQLCEDVHRSPSDILNVVLSLCLVIEDLGHKLGASAFVQDAQQYVALLVRYAAQAIPDNAQRYAIIKPQLMLYVQSGAYYSTSVLAQAALEAIENENPLEAIAMRSNLGAIHVHLDRLAQARSFYRDALNSARRFGAPRELIGAIQRNYDGLATGYDPDFIFLPDSTPEPVDSSRMVDAARDGRFDQALAMLRQGCDINARDEYGSTALIYAVAAHNEAVVKTLLDSGADVNLLDHDHRSALLYSILWGCPASIVRLLIEHGADTETGDSSGVTPLMLAAMLQSDEQITRLLRGSGR